MPIKRKTIFEIDYGSLEDIVKNHYGINKYSFVATEECGNDSEHMFSVSKKESLDEYEQEYIQDLRNGERPSYINGTILQDLVNEGVLEAGEYLVTVCW